MLKADGTLHNTVEVDLTGSFIYVLKRTDVFSHEECSVRLSPEENVKGEMP